jgi:hypothetical protein
MKLNYKEIKIGIFLYKQFELFIILILFINNVINMFENIKYFNDKNE